MKYIRVKNAGEIEPQALTLLGASTKRNDTTKIGQFGSGNKYALAYLLRNDYGLKIFSGETEIAIDVRKEKYRENEYGVIHINGQQTSITTEFGKDWEFWQALREIYCNALDEGQCEMDYVQNITPKAGETHFYIQNKEAAVEFLSKFDDYFSVNKKVLFECAEGSIIEKSGTTANIYRKGIKCFNSNKQSTYDYTFNNIKVDENRLVTYTWQVEETMWNIIYQCTDKEVIKSILHNCGNSNFIEGSISDISSISASKISPQFMECLKELRLAPAGYAGLLKPDEVHNHIIVPTKIFESLRGKMEDEMVPDKFKVSRRGVFFREIPMDNLCDATLRKVMDFFNECGVVIPYEIKLAIFDNKDVYGYADIEDETIYVSQLCVEQGTNMLANCILEEYIHIKYKVMDETRAFQNAMFSEFIAYLKSKNAYLL